MTDAENLCRFLGASGKLWASDPPWPFLVNSVLGELRGARVIRVPVPGRPLPHSDRTRTGPSNRLSCDDLQTVRGSSTRAPKPRAGVR